MSLKKKISILTTNITYIHESDNTHTLGLVWHAKSDSLTYSVKDINVNVSKICKRNIPSTISTIFDPLGLISPIIIRSKILLQKIWQCKEGWDSPLPQSINDEWIKLTNELVFINDIKIKRQALRTKAKYRVID